MVAKLVLEQSRPSRRRYLGLLRRGSRRIVRPCTGPSHRAHPVVATWHLFGGRIKCEHRAVAAWGDLHQFPPIVCHRSTFLRKQRVLMPGLLCLHDLLRLRRCRDESRKLRLVSNRVARAIGAEVDDYRLVVFKHPANVEERSQAALTVPQHEAAFGVACHGGVLECKVFEPTLACSWNGLHGPIANVVPPLSVRGVDPNVPMTSLCQVGLHCSITAVCVAYEHAAAALDDLAALADILQNEPRLYCQDERIIGNFQDVQR